MALDKEHHTHEQPQQSPAGGTEKLSLWNKTKQLVKKVVTQLEKAKDTLTAQVETKTAEELYNLHTEVVAAQPDAPQDEFDLLKDQVKKSVEQLHTHETNNTKETIPSSGNNHINNSDYGPGHLTPGVSSEVAQQSYAREQRAISANTVAQMIDTELLDPDNRSII